VLPRDKVISAPVHSADFGDDRPVGPRLALVLATGFVFAAELVAILIRTGGRMLYSLDDAYIHLALGRQIGLGHYGINPGEASAPCSSILWPLLLALFSRLPGYAYAPLILNVAACLLLLFLGQRLFQQLFPAAGWPWLAALLATLMIPALNLVGLVFTGMEHLYQLLSALLIAQGLIRGQTGRSEGAGFFAAALIGPLIRFENTLLSLIAVIWLLLRHRRLPAIGVGFGVACLLGGYSLFLHALGLGWLPASVTAKSVAAFGGHTSLASNLMTNLSHRQALVLLLAAILLLAQWQSRPPLRRLIGLTLVAIGCHLVFGRFGWADRYEVYVLGFTLFILLYLYQPWLSRKSPWLWSSVLMVLVLPYALNWLLTPLGCHNIYQQHHQMARFSRDYVQAPVAVNDLGCVAFASHHYVLDLWGLASPEVLRLKRQSLSSDWMDRLAQAHQVQVAMIYDSYFPDRPEHWRCLAKLYLGSRQVTADQAVVSFYSLTPESVAALHRQLRAFAKTLPAGVRLVVRQEPSSFLPLGAPSL